MASFRMSVTYSATVKFSSTKGCFVFVPDTWLRDPVDLHVFKLFYGDGQEAFVSCLPYRTTEDNPESQILMHGKFAEKLKLKEKEKICLQQWFSSVPAVQEIRLEPLTPDDWEILELNATYVERDLMNQIRIVWCNQVFPVWVNNSSLFVKVAQTHPNVQPVLLVEFTEVHIVPMGRRDPEHCSEANPNEVKKASHHLQFQHLRNSQKEEAHPLKSINFRSLDCVDGPYHSFENKSTVARAFSLLSSFFPATGEQKPSYLDDIYRDFVPLSLDFVLRTIPYTRPHARSLSTVVQATTVFISADTYVARYGAENIPPCFVAVLRKFPPSETCTEKASGSNHQKESRSSVKNRQDKNKSKEDLMDEERQPAFSSVCVTVMVVQSSEEDEFNLTSSLFYSKDAIVVPKELKRCLNLEVSSLVHLVGVQIKPIIISTVVLHPVTHMSSNISNEDIYASFEKLAFGNKRQNSAYVLSDGTLLNMRVLSESTKLDFFITVKEHLNQTLNSSSSSMSSVSPNSSDLAQKKYINSEPKYGYLNSTNIKDIQLIIGPLMSASILVDRPYLKKPEALYQEIPALQLDTLGGINELAEKALENLEFWLKLRPISYISNHPFTFFGCMLICGPKGVGKSVFANALCKKLTKPPHHVFVKVINCLPLKGKRVETIAKKWDEVVNDAVYSQPSIILFEDLDYIASCPTSHEQEFGPDGVYFSNIVQMFLHMVAKINESNSKVAVLVTSQSTHSLHPTLMNTKGRHVFQSIIDVQPPTVEQREDIIRSLVLSKRHISAKSIESIAWKKIAKRTEGYVALDLDSLVDRATHAAWVRMANNPKSPEMILNLEDFEMALEGYIPSSLRGIPLQVHDHKTWEDVGGLKEVKKVIQQIIMWPIKYKQIFKSYSLKPQTNILLYGAPGTGKTLLAGVIANECGLNFISIKGPELLSKYIGASEQAIRDLFKRASAARPCILFFDEFDSIAPRRGHDSTGVTDRVVNQLLTQLDGVESLEGVHVIAASSRPELIDPALLRPGRLDKCLLCPLPSEDERYEILKCLSSKLSVSDDIDLEYIAARTEYFSGADLQALLYTANIEALHETQSRSTRRYSASSDDRNYSIASDKLLYMPSVEDGLSVPTYEDGKKIVQEVDIIKENFCGIMERRRSRKRSTLNIAVNQDHLLKVMEEMKPSVSPQERMRYEAVFKNFQNVLSGEPAISQTETVKRVTLA